MCISTHLFNGLSNSQKPVVLQQGSLLISQALRNVLALLLGQHNTIEAIIDHMVIVESTRILREGIDLAAQCAPCSAVNRMAVRSAVDVWTGGVDRGVDHVCGGVEESALAAVNDLAGVVDEDKVGLVDEAKGDTKGVHPEAIWLDRVAHGDVAGDALVGRVSLCLHHTRSSLYTPHQNHTFQRFGTQQRVCP